MPQFFCRLTKMCGKHRNCVECTADPYCGWSSDGTCQSQAEFRNLIQVHSLNQYLIKNIYVLKDKALTPPTETDPFGDLFADSLCSPATDQHQIRKNTIPSNGKYPLPLYYGKIYHFSLPALINLSDKCVTYGTERLHFFS